jgi:hypothetical protein
VNDKNVVQTALCAGAGNRPRVSYQVLDTAGLKEFAKLEQKVIKKYTAKDKQTAQFYTQILNKKTALLRQAKAKPTLITPTDQPPANCVSPTQVGK